MGRQLMILLKENELQIYLEYHKQKKNLKKIMWIQKRKPAKHIIKSEKLLEMLLNKQGGTMPEDLPTPKKSLKQLEKEKSNKLKRK